jgi:hypothetical protein
VLDRVIDLAYRAAKFAFRPSKTEVLERENEALYCALRHLYDCPDAGRASAGAAIAQYEASRPDKAIPPLDAIKQDIKLRAMVARRTGMQPRFDQGRFDLLSRRTVLRAV